MRAHAKSVAALLAALTLSAACAPQPPAPTAPAAAMNTQAPLTWTDLLARPKPVADKSFRYGPDPFQVADLWLPRHTGLHPVVLMVHGGCWTTRIADRTLMNYAAADLRARGIAVWNIDYRGVDRPGGAPNGIFADVAAAADLLRAHAAAERLDIARVVAVGHSAGGHLALWLAARPRVTGAALPRQIDPLPIRHVVSLGGLPDLDQAAREPQGCGPEPVLKLAGPRPDPVERYSERLPQGDRYTDKSIPLLAPLGVPQTLVNGDADRIIPTHFAAEYAAKMRAKGDRVTVRIVPGQGHVDLIAPGTPAWATAVNAIERALGRR